MSEVCARAREADCAYYVVVGVDPATGLERATTLEGRPEDPVSRGKYCIKGMGFVAAIYDPGDTVDRPPRRTHAQTREKNRGEGHQIHRSHEHDGLSSHRISFGGSLQRERFIDAVKAAPRSNFRIKGVVEFVDADKPLLFQYVGGRFEFSEFNHPRMPDRFLILIGQNIETDSLRPLLKKFEKINLNPLIKG